jgi:hypothetical protein
LYSHIRIFIFFDILDPLYSGKRLFFEAEIAICFAFFGEKLRNLWIHASGVLIVTPAVEVLVA